MSGKVHTITKVIARAGHEAAVRSLLQEVTELASQEVGCLRYTLWQGHANPAEFVTIGEWLDDAAFQSYFRSSYLEEFMREVEERVDHPPDVQWYEAVM